MNCPIDHTKLEKKSYENTVEIEYCNKCEGMWLDPKELEQIQNLVLNDYKEELNRIPDYVGNSILMAKSKGKENIPCPICDELMERREYGYCSQVYIDSCINGHGIWLDKDEIKDLELFYERARIDAKEIRRGFLKSLGEHIF